MMPSSSVDTATQILEALSCGADRCSCRTAIRRGRGQTHCPSHQDATPSLSVACGEDGQPLVHCFAACPSEAVIAHLTARGLWHVTSDRRTRSDRAPITWYPYCAADGTLLGYHCRRNLRSGEKQVWFAGPDRKPSKNGAIVPERLPLYRVRDLPNRPADLVLMVEGEKCADAAHAVGFLAVSLSGGAKQPRFGDALDALAGRDVVLLPDHDAPGHGLMRRVANTLVPIATSVRWCTLPDLAPGGDIADFLAAGGTREQIQTLIATAPDAVTHGVDTPCALCDESERPQSRVASDDALPPFPLVVLPEVVQTFVETAARSLDAPPDLVAVPLLVNTAGVIGNRFRLQIKESWIVTAILWAAIVAPPGSAKSPAEQLARRPLMRLQREAKERHAAELLDYEADLARWTADKSGDKGAKPQRPHMVHFYTTDATMEALAPMFASSPGVVLIRDELSGWVKSFDAYRGGKGGDRQKWLSLWAGEPQKIDRKGADPIVLDDPAVSVCGGIQPDVLSDLADEAGRRDGFIERILWSYPNCRAMRLTDADLDPELVGQMADVYRRLRGGDGGRTILLEPVARQAFYRWHHENADLIETASGTIAGMYAKLPGQLTRLALVLHVLTHADAPTHHRLSATTMRDAITLVEYFRAHAHRALTHFGAVARVAHPLSVRLQHVLEVAGDWLASAELHRRLGGHERAELLHTALAELQRLGLVEHRELPAGDKGGRRQQEWRWCELTESTELTGTQPATTPALPLASRVDSVDSVDSQIPPEGVCRYCGSIGITKGQCFACDNRPCQVCGEETGFALRPICLPCLNRGMSAQPAPIAPGDPRDGETHEVRLHPRGGPNEDHELQLDVAGCEAGGVEVEDATGKDNPRE